MAMAILDDLSRLCCHLQFYLAETAECLVHGLTQAVLKRGLPRALMTDNGAAMLAEETRRGLRRLAIHHETTLSWRVYCLRTKLKTPPAGSPGARHTTISTGPSTDKPIPALLRKWLADYAATGLPPAYLPKDQICHE